METILTKKFLNIQLQQFCKRLFDLFFSGIAIIIFSPLLILVSIAILIEDGMPILFKQERIGRNFKIFQVFKFRTMRENKITVVGKLLRNRGIDEILQFINVIKGDMSIVGPRPLTQNDIVRLKWNNNNYMIRWSVKPGITGMAQIFSGSGSKISIYLDKKYICNSSLSKDLFLILISFCINLFGKTKVKVSLRFLNRNSKKIIGWLILSSYILIICVISLSAYLNIIPGWFRGRGIPGYDIFMHFILTGMLAYLLEFYFRLNPYGIGIIKIPKFCFWILIIAIIDEVVIQPFFPCRRFSYCDLFANISGILLFGYYAYFNRKNECKLKKLPVSNVNSCSLSRIIQ